MSGECLWIGTLSLLGVAFKLGWDELALRSKEQSYVERILDNNDLRCVGELRLFSCTS